jgi:hypothetical protein
VSLYHHVANKDDILDGLERALAARSRSAPARRGVEPRDRLGRRQEGDHLSG